MHVDIILQLFRKHNSLRQSRKMHDEDAVESWGEEVLSADGKSTNSSAAGVLYLSTGCPSVATPR